MTGGNDSGGIGGAVGTVSGGNGPNGGGSNGTAASGAGNGQAGNGQAANGQAVNGAHSLVPDRDRRTYSLRAIYFRRELFSSPADCLTAAHLQQLPLELCQ